MLKNCPKCGNQPTWKPNNYMCDQLECISCDIRTGNYWDGAEYACDEWNKTVVPNYGKMQLDEALRLVKNIKWISVEKDNMEFGVFEPISCYQLDAINMLIEHVEKNLD